MELDSLRRKLEASTTSALGAQQERGPTSSTICSLSHGLSLAATPHVGVVVGRVSGYLQVKQVAENKVSDDLRRPEVFTGLPMCCQLFHLLSQHLGRVDGDSFILVMWQ